MKRRTYKLYSPELSFEPAACATEIANIIKANHLKAFAISEPSVWQGDSDRDLVIVNCLGHDYYENDCVIIPNVLMTAVKGAMK